VVKLLVMAMCDAGVTWLEASAVRLVGIAACLTALSPPHKTSFWPSVRCTDEAQALGVGPCCHWRLWAHTAVFRLCVRWDVV
jgi:hypothetical protein